MTPETKDFIDNLNCFQAKAGCIYSQNQAIIYWRRIKPYLTEDQERDLKIAWNHHRYIGEGRQELDEVCNKIINKLNEEIIGTG
jgi:hypothetical protein